MKLLAIETSCEHASIALRIDDAHLERELDGHSTHSEYLLDNIRQLLAEAACSLTALDGIAFGAGPGAFTGLRLACGVAQGLAMGAGLGVVPVSSLAALALQSGEGRTFALTDARMGELYAASFLIVQSSLPIALDDPVCQPPERVKLPDDQTGWCLIGSGLAAHGAVLEQRFASRYHTWTANAFPRAQEVLTLARMLLDSDPSHALAPEYAAPFYVRNKVALTTEERTNQGGKA